MTLLFDRNRKQGWVETTGKILSIGPLINNLPHGVNKNEMRREKEWLNNLYNRSVYSFLRISFFYLPSPFLSPLLYIIFIFCSHLFLYLFIVDFVYELLSFLLHFIFTPLSVFPSVFCCLCFAYITLSLTLSPSISFCLSIHLFYHKTTKLSQSAVQPSKRKNYYTSAMLIES